jgi:hypothetical protein
MPVNGTNRTSHSCRRMSAFGVKGISMSGNPMSAFDPWPNGGDTFQVLTKIGSPGTVALGCDPLKDGDVLVIEAGWKALRNRQCDYDLRMCDRRCERRRIGTNVVSARAH